MCVCNALPHFLDRQLRSGERRIGFLPQLADTLGLGHHSFDDGNEETRFRQFLRSGTRMAMAFAVHWGSLQLEVGLDAPGPLRTPIEAAGAPCLNFSETSLGRGSERASKR